MPELEICSTLTSLFSKAILRLLKQVWQLSVFVWVHRKATLPHFNSLATLDKILWQAVKSGVACIACKCGQCLKVQLVKTLLLLEK